MRRNLTFPTRAAAHAIRARPSAPRLLAIAMVDGANVEPASPPRRRSASPLANVVANAGGFLISAVTAYVMTPFLIRHLGDTHYGLLVFVGELTLYAAMVDLGLRGAVPIFVAQHQGRGDSAGVARVTSSVFWTLTILAGVMAAVALPLASWWSAPATLGPREPESGVLLIAVAGVLAALPLDVFSGALAGSRRLDLVNAADGSGKLLVTLLVYAGLTAGYGIAYVVTVQATGRIVTGIAFLILARLVVEGLSVARSDTSVAELSSLFHFCSRTFTMNLARMLSDRSDAIIITSLLGLRFVTYYAVPKMMVDYCLAAVAAVATGLTPHFARLYAREESQRLRDAFLDAARLTGLGALMFVAYLAAFGESFLRLWLGARYVEESGAPVVLVILLVAYVPRLLQSPSWQLIFASRHVGPATRIVIAEGVVKLALALLLVPHYGIYGVAVATLVAFCFTSGVLVPRHVLRAFAIPARPYILLAVVRPVLCAGLTFALSAMLVSAIPALSWRALVAEAAGAGVLGLGVCWFIGLTSSDRRAGLSVAMRMRTALFRR
jgi:O-antigen/teichoic acid export membrane protein